MSEPVIIEAVRTPFGRRSGAFREVRPDTLLARALSGLIERVGIDPAEIEDVINGTVTQTGEQGANVGRLAVMLAGFPVTVPAVSLNRMCGSSQQAVHFASQAIAAGDMGYVVGCGVESMTRALMFSDLGGVPDAGSVFSMLNPDLLEKQELVHQGESAERIAAQWGISREDVDALSTESHRRASEAAREGLNKEVIPTRGLDPDGNEVELSSDEGIRGILDPEKMAGLKTVFRPDGVVTAGNSSQISDGAAAVLVADRDRAETDGLAPKASFRARVVIGSDPAMQLTGVIPATRLALKRSGLSMDELDWIEINEAFATVVLSWADELEPDMDRVNPWGGAIAHGHPLGATGAGLMAKMLAGLEATGGRFGLQVMCIGHGMSTATVIERL